MRRFLANLGRTEEALSPIPLYSPVQHRPRGGANRALAEANGEFFIPVDADNIAAPNMVEGFLRGMRSRPDLSAMTCFFAAFENTGRYCAW